MESAGATFGGASGRQSSLKSEIIKIIAAHAEHNGNLAKAAEALGCSRQTVSRYWKKVGLVAQGNAGRKPCSPQGEIDKIVAAHAEHGGNAARAAEVLGRSRQTVSKYWKQAGLVANGHSQSIDRCCLPQSEIIKIIAAHAEHNGNLIEAAEALKRGKNTVSKYWKRAGLAAQGNAKGKKGLPQSEIDKIIATHAEHSGIAARAAKALGRGIETVLRYWKTTGLAVQPKEKKSLVVLAERSFDGLIKAFCHLYDLTPEELMSATREARVAWPRQMLMYALREEVHSSFPEIARALNRENHTTIMHACKKVRKKIEIMVPLREEVLRIRQLVRTALLEEPNNSESAREERDNSRALKKNKTEKSAVQPAKSRRGLPQSEIDKIIAAHAEHSGIAARAAKALGRGIETVLRYWKTTGLAAEGNIKGKRSLPQNEVDKIVAAHAEHHGSLTKAAEALKHSTHTVSKYWKKAGLVAEGWRSSSQSEIDKIIAAHAEHHGSLTKAAGVLKRSKHTVLKYWKLAGLNRPR